MVRPETKAPSVGDKLMERLRDLTPSIRDRAEQTERDRRVDAQVLADLGRCGLFRILQPKMFGGLEAGWETMMAATHEVSRACGSTGWVAGLAMAHQWLIAAFPIEAQHDVWGGNPGAIAFGSYMPAGRAKRTKDGFSLSGAWRFASGCDNGDWALLGAMIPLEDGAEALPGFFLVPRADYAIEDDWHAMGLCGTGSKTIHCDGVHVPPQRKLTFADATTGRSPGGGVHDSPLYKMPMLSCLPMSICVPSLGILDGAIAEFQDKIRDRPARGAIVKSGKTIADFESVQSRFAEAVVSLDAARLLIHRDLAEAFNDVRTRGSVSKDARMRNRLSQAYVVRLAVRAIDGLLDAGGGAGIYLDNPIQRAWRDINTAARHIAFSWGAVSAMYGQHALGRTVVSSVGY